MSSVVPLRTPKNEASEWLARLNSEHATEEDHVQFAAWAAGDPLNRHAFDELRITWRRLEALGNFADLTLAIDKPPGRRAPRRSVLAAAAAAAAVAVLAGAVVWMRSDGVQTAIGEQRRVALSDATVVELNTDTRLDLRFVDRERRVRLKRGEASFKVTPQPDRPFIVEAEGHEVRVVGTAFTVRKRGEHIDVLVEEGAVRLDQRMLRAGQAMNTGHPDVLLTPSAEEIERRLAWKDGMVSFRGESLREVLDELARYTRIRVEVADSPAASLRISGYFRATDIPAFLARLEENFQVEVRREARRVVIASRPPASGR